MNFEVPYLKYGHIRCVANKFLSEYHPSGDVPIPIEDIVELKLGLTIAPFPDLYTEINLSSFLTADRSIIFVDEKQYSAYAEKYRFSLAHEVGHYILHDAYYEKLPFADVASYKTWRLSADREMVYRFEVQGNLFAELVLIPGPQLFEVSTQVVRAHQTDLKGMKADAWPYLAKEVAERFDVSPQAMLIRIRNEDIPSLVPLPA